VVGSDTATLALLGVPPAALTGELNGGKGLGASEDIGVGLTEAGARMRPPDPRGTGGRCEPEYSRRHPQAHWYEPCFCPRIGPHLHLVRRVTLLGHDEVLEFIRLHFPARYCVSCISVKLGATLTETRRLLVDLLDGRAVMVGTRSCDGCGEVLEVLAPEPSRKTA
jgi:hypothetical protein